MKFMIFCTALLVPSALSGQVSSVNFQNKSAIGVFDLVITEIMADPDPTNGLPVAEFVEIYNRSQTMVSLQGWTLFDGSSRILPSKNLLPGEYAIICANSDTSDFVMYGKTFGVTSLSLTNTGEKISIRDPLGNPIDSVTYSDGWYGSSFKKDGGWSLERVDLNFTCAVAFNWKPSENISGGTPSSLNSVNGVINDFTPPSLERAFCENDTTLILTFNETIESADAISILNYTIVPSISVVNALAIDIDKQIVQLQLANPVQKKTIYQIFAEGIHDCAGNLIVENKFVRCGLADSILKNDLTINEVLFDPFAGGYDFVELFVKSQKIIDVSSLKIASIDSITNQPEVIETVSENHLLLFPEDYLIITENPEIVAQQYRSTYPLNFLKVSNLPSMNIDEGYIAILSNGNRIDEFKYRDDLHFQLLRETKGISLEKINPFLNSMQNDSWHSASPEGGFATPGFINSQYSDLTKKENEVTVYPEIFSPDNDGLDDVVTFSIKPGEPGYLSNLWLYNAEGSIVFSKNQNSLLPASSSFTWNGIDDNGNIASAGIYVAYIQIYNLEGKVINYKLPFVLALKF